MGAEEALYPLLLGPYEDFGGAKLGCALFISSRLFHVELPP